MQSNPYQAPAADLQTASAIGKKSMWWKIYFIFITGFSLLGFLGISMDENAGSAEYALLSVFIVATVGMAGFVFNKRILQPRFWMYVAFFYLFLSILYYFVTRVDLSAGMSQGEYIGWTIFAWVVAIPGYWALFRYGSADYPLWRHASNN